MKKNDFLSVIKENSHTPKLFKQKGLEQDNIKVPKPSKFKVKTNKNEISENGSSTSNTLSDYL